MRRSSLTPLAGVVVPDPGLLRRQVAPGRPRPRAGLAGGRDGEPGPGRRPSAAHRGGEQRAGGPGVGGLVGGHGARRPRQPRPRRPRRRGLGAQPGTPPGGGGPCRSSPGPQPGGAGPGRRPAGGGGGALPPGRRHPRAVGAHRGDRSASPTVPARSGATPPKRAVSAWASGWCATGPWLMTWTRRRISPGSGCSLPIPIPPRRWGEQQLPGSARGGGRDRGPDHSGPGPGHRGPSGRHRLRMRRHAGQVGGARLRGFRPGAHRRIEGQLGPERRPG